MPRVQGHTRDSEGWGLLSGPKAESRRALRDLSKTSCEKQSMKPNSAQTKLYLGPIPGAENADLETSALIRIKQNHAES